MRPPPVCDVINRIRGPFNTALLQQLAGAAAMRDQAHVEAPVAHNTKWLRLDHGRNPQDRACGWMTASPISC